MSTRLSNNIKEALLRQLLPRAFKARGEELVKRSADYADRLYRDALAAELTLISSLPEGWLLTDDDIKVQLGAGVVQVKFRGDLDGQNMGERRWGGFDLLEVPNRRFPSNKKAAVVKVYPGDHPLVQEYRDLSAQWEGLNEEIGRARRAARNAMDSVSTVKKLIDVWPEVEEFAKHYLEDGDRKAVLPAIPREHLNKVLVLPPQEKAA